MGIHASLEKGAFPASFFSHIRRRPSGEKIASSSVSLTECSAGSGRRSHNQGPTRSHTRVHACTLSHTSRRGRSHESRPSPIYVPPRCRRQPSRSLSCAVCGVLFTSNGRAGPLRCPTPHPEGAHLRSSPPGIADTPRGRVSSLRPPAHDIRRPPRDQCTRTSCSSSSSKNGSNGSRECVQASRASSSTSTHATASGVAGSRGTWAPINSRRPQ